MRTPLLPGSVVWVSLDPTIRREQAGTRPAVIVASEGLLRAVPELAIVLPATTTDRSWPHHVELSGPALTLPHTTFAMTEQPRTVRRRRFTGSAGHVPEGWLALLRRWLDDFPYQPNRNG